MSLTLENAKQIVWADHIYKIYEADTCFTDETQTWKCPRCRGTKGAMAAQWITQFGIFYDVTVACLVCAECDRRIGVREKAEHGEVVPDEWAVRMNVLGQRSLLEPDELEDMVYIP